MTDLETSWEETVKQINAKIKEAAQALKDARLIADKAGVPVLIHTQYTGDYLDMDDEEMDEFYEKVEDIDVSPLENEMDRAGWSMSSSYC